MKFLDMVKVDDLNIDLIQRYGRLFGLSEHALQKVDVISDFINIVKGSNKYTTLGDVLQDSELVDDLMKLVSNINNENTSKSDENSLVLDINSTITCPKCKHITTLKKITRR